MENKRPSAFESTPFKEYLDKVKGIEVDIDFGKRQLSIFNSTKDKVSEVSFSKSIQQEFTLADLIKTDHVKGEKSYSVFESGHQNKDWLWAVDIVDVLKMNNTKEYYFLIGKDKNGPFPIEQLLDKKLTNETLIWTEGMENWEKLKNIQVLFDILKPKSVPPPPPTENEIGTNKTTLTWLIAWCAFHLFALIMSYSQVPIFNDNGRPSTQNFWPFVDFQRDKYNAIYQSYIEGSGKTFEELRNEKYFNGIFTDYDWSEFLVYVGGALIIYLLIRISKKE